MSSRRKPSGQAAPRGKVSGDRAMVFAQAALKKKLVTAEQARECVRIARKLKQSKKPLPIEVVFVRKGYLRRTEAASIVKRIRPKGSQPALGLAPEAPRAKRRCVSCERNPGEDEDCYHCGADQHTGGPGPRATICESCSGVVLRGSAICFHCGQTMRSRARLKAQGGSGFVDRLIVLLTILGVGYFLIYRNLVAPQEPASAEALPAQREADPALEAALSEAARLAQAKERGKAAQVLQAALLSLRPDADPLDRGRVLRALALVASGEEAVKAARAGLTLGEDSLLRRRLAELAWGAGDASGVKRELAKVPLSERRDPDWRLLAAAERKLGGPWEEALLELKAPRAEERDPLALALWRRGLEHLGVKRVAEALKDLERACELSPKRSALHGSLGAAYLEAGKHAEARASYQAGLRAEPIPTHYLGLGLAEEGLNERAAAIRSYESFLQITQGVSLYAERAEQVRARIKRLQAPLEESKSE